MHFRKSKTLAPLYLKGMLHWLIAMNGFDTVFVDVSRAAYVEQVRAVVNLCSGESPLELS